MKTSLKERVIKWLAIRSDWIPKGEILSLDWKYEDGRTYMSDTVSRKLRESEEEGRIAVKTDPASNSVLYKFLPVDRRANYIPYSSRPDDRKNVLFRV